MVTSKGSICKGRCAKVRTQLFSSVGGVRLTVAGCVLSCFINCLEVTMWSAGISNYFIYRTSLYNNQRPTSGIKWEYHRYGYNIRLSRLSISYNNIQYMYTWSSSGCIIILIAQLLYSFGVFGRFITRERCLTTTNGNLRNQASPERFLTYLVIAWKTPDILHHFEPILLHIATCVPPRKQQENLSPSPVSRALFLQISSQDPFPSAHIQKMFIWAKYRWIDRSAHCCGLTFLVRTAHLPTKSSSMLHVSTIGLNTHLESRPWRRSSNSISCTMCNFGSRAKRGSQSTTYSCANFR